MGWVPLQPLEFLFKNGVGNSMGVALLRQRNITEKQAL
jgi:hypothetical protein